MLMRRAVIALFGGCLMSGLGLAAAVMLEACSSSGGESTGGKRVVLSTRVTLDPSGAASFSNAAGWSITLTKAALAAGPFYYFDGAPPLVYNEPSRSWQYAERALGVGVAHAHPGHYQAGNAMGQMLETDALDLLAGPAEFPSGDGVTGTYRSARFTLAAPSASARALLQGHSVLVEGKAEKEGEPPRLFRAHADLDAIETHASGGKVEGCELSEVQVEGDGTITLTVKPQVWFDLVDFSDAPAGTPDAPADLPEDSMAQLGFIVGVTQLSAYQFAYEAN